ncbi:MAG: acyltransferase [Bacteroidaceae bacterium]|nr:acyltransferase [Bacteroidaceae bacterium]
MGKSLKTRLKENVFLRGMKYLYKSYFGFSRSKFGYCGENVSLNPPLTLSNPKNIFLYGDNKLDNAVVLATNAKFIMKEHSAAAQGLKVATGGHAMIIGRNYREVTEAEKPKGLDKDVVVEENVWIGMNVILLAGIVVGRGSTVAAGSVVTKSLPPYCIAGGVPAKPIKLKWNIDEILEHERILYAENERFTREQLEEIYSKYNLL